MRKFRYFLYVTTAMLGAVMLVGGAICAITGTVVLLLGFQREGLSGLVNGFALLIIGLNLLDFGYAGMEQEVRRISQQPLKEIPKPCRGCQNFHGGRYGGVMLVCGIHPHGVEGDICPDFRRYGE
ncbi:hypothetical protein [Anabaena azotica]|uniref:Uncharacterized protein n=1 Tax=Anabaena azotica FACHB-119 TaxID=947527 RepID=A0ABR8DG36_9NOST|nr:hypothetical protein [Anabaena azotica]MBD2504698.1 hypothetical protein [Anabaena azotica FACHB-119]